MPTVSLCCCCCKAVGHHCLQLAYAVAALNYNCISSDYELFTYVLVYTVAAVNYKYMSSDYELFTNWFVLLSILIISVFSFCLYEPI